MFHARSKNIEIQYHFVREKVMSKEIDIQHVRTDLQIADIFTKFLDSVKLKKFSSKMNLIEIWFSGFLYRAWGGLLQIQALFIALELLRTYL